MRLLVTIPHYCRRGDGPGALPYGSDTGDTGARLACVARALATLQQTFGARQDLACSPEFVPANITMRGDVQIALVTTGDQHLADQLPRHLFTQVSTEVEPLHLGFVCHELMRDQAGRFDYYAYLEDDIEVADPLFFAKLHWFTQTFGQSTLLQPNRFELAHDLETMKLYVDGDTVMPEVPARFQDITTRPRLIGDAFGRSFLFQRVSNVHSGSFFLNAAQLVRVASSPRWGKPSAEFFGPLETAATLMPMLGFEVYKPARENAAFLEVQHLGRRFLHRMEAADPAPA